MNVEFRCPNCHSRFFGPPTAQGVGGKSRRQCPKPECNQVHYEQTEAFGGESDQFAFVDDKRQVHYADPDEAAMAGLGDEEKKLYLRERIKTLTGRRPDGRLGLGSLQDMFVKARAEAEPLPPVDETMKTGDAV
jgi:hypothetical protein